MIKPFEIIGTRPVEGLGTGVTYKVWRTEFSKPGHSQTLECETFIIVPDGENIEEYLFEVLSKSGWI